MWKLPPIIGRWWDRRALLELGGEEYTVEDAQRYTRNYIQPDCQSVDPSGLEDFRCIVPTRVPLFAAMDRILHSPGSQRFLIVLADSGMGKTAFLLNYYARHRRRMWWRRRDFEVKLVPLNQPNTEKSSTVLFRSASGTAVITFSPNWPGPAGLGKSAKLETNLSQKPVWLSRLPGNSCQRIFNPDSGHRAGRSSETIGLTSLRL